MTQASPIRLTRLSVGVEEAEAVNAVLASGHLVQGPMVARFEGLLAEYLGVRNVVAVSTGTTAIQLALAAMDIGPGDEVIVPDFVFPSVAAAVLFLGATPVVCDVDSATFNVDVECVRRAVSPKTRALVAVHQFGVPCDAMALQDAVGVPVIEDAACALGATDRLGPCGTQTGLGCLSFHPRKLITTAEGGAVVVLDDTAAARLRHLRTHGMRPAAGVPGVAFPEFGYAGRMSDVHAAIGVAQMPKLPGIIAGRARAAAIYRDLLELDDRILTSSATWHPGRVYQGLVVRTAPGYDRDRVVLGLREAGVESTIGTYAIHAQEGLRQRVRVPDGGLAGSLLAARSSLTLPLYPDMTGDEVDVVVAALARVLPKARS